MGRTLHYKIYCDPELYASARPDIDKVRKEMNYRFTWTVENLKLDATHPDEQDLWRPRDGVEPSVPAAWGFTKVGADEWNALLVFRFIEWVSRRIPRAFVTLHDEGDFVLAHHLVFLGGQALLDATRIHENGERLAAHGRRSGLDELQENVLLGLHGVLYRRVSASDYTDRNEIEQMWLKPETLANLSIDEVATRMRFPWYDLRAAA